MNATTSPCSSPSPVRSWHAACHNFRHGVQKQRGSSTMPVLDLSAGMVGSSKMVAPNKTPQFLCWSISRSPNLIWSQHTSGKFLPSRQPSTGCKRAAAPVHSSAGSSGLSSACFVGFLLVGSETLPEAHEDHEDAHPPFNVD